MCLLATLKTEDVQTQSTEGGVISPASATYFGSIVTMMYI